MRCHAKEKKKLLHSIIPNRLYWTK